MKERTVLINLRAKTSVPIRILRKAKNHQLMVRHDRGYWRGVTDEIKVLGARARVIRRSK